MSVKEFGLMKIVIYYWIGLKTLLLEYNNDQYLLLWLSQFFLMVSAANVWGVSMWEWVNALPVWDMMV